jgi:transposase
VCAAPVLLQLRMRTAEETAQLRALAQSRTAEARVRDRAQICWASAQGARVMAIVAQFGHDEKTVRTWITRFNAGGFPALADAPRSGRPPLLSGAQVREVRTVALAEPRTLDCPFSSWTLDRLTAYLQEERHLPIHRTRVAELLRAAGLPWRHHETWFGDRPDPAFAEKRGPFSPPTPRRRPTPSSSASMNWDR